MILANQKWPLALRYHLGFAEQGQRFELTEERIESEQPDAGHDKPYIFCFTHNGHVVLNYKEGTQRQLRPEEIDPEQSILAQRKGPRSLPGADLPR